MAGREPLDVEQLLRENENLREQRQAVGEVLRAVARSEGLQPVLDAIVEAARSPRRRPPRNCSRCSGRTTRRSAS
jgi:translation elongation factor EF-G